MKIKHKEGSNRYPGMKRKAQMDSNILPSGREKWDPGKYPNRERYELLVSRSNMFGTTEERQEFIDHFYFDEQYNEIFGLWMLSGYHRLLVPSLDHMTSRHNGGSNKLSNLQFISYIENQMKNYLNWDEWERFKEVYHIKADFLFTWG